MHRSLAVPTSLSLVVAAALLSCAPARPKRARRKPSIPKLPPPSVVALAEARPVTALAASGRRVYVGTPDGLVVWHLGRSEFEEWGAGHGLPNPDIRALATDDRAGVWVLSEGGLHLYNEDHFVSFDDPPPELRRAHHVVASKDGRTAWVGGLGVMRVRDGAFQTFLPGARVTTMARDADGEGVWVGTKNEGAYRFAVDRFLRFGSDWGLKLKEIDGIALTRKGNPILSGGGTDGKRLAYFDGRRFWEYWVAAAEVRVLGTTGKNVRVAADRKFWMLRIGGDPGGDGPSVVPTEHGAPDLWLWKGSGEVPHEMTVVLAAKQGLFLGTPSVGVIRSEGEALRTRDVRGDRDRLAVGCDAVACYLAAGGGRLYRLQANGRSLELGDIGSDRVLWVTNDPAGDVIVLLAIEGQSSVQLTRYDNGQFVPRHGRELHVPSGEPYVNYAQYSPSGDLWVSLGFINADGEAQNYAVAVMRPSGEVTYHRASSERKAQTDDGTLPIPEQVRGIAFGAGATWLATFGGLIRIETGKATHLGSGDTPVGELCSDIAVGKDGVLWAVSPDGIGRYENGKWNAVSREGLLERGASALKFDPKGELFIGTPGGAYRWEGSSGERIEGTVGDIVLDLEIDRFGRLWVLTTDGYSVHAL